MEIDPAIRLSPFGFRIVTSELVGEQYEDWSAVRSPSRAIRRRRQGHRQRVTVRYRACGKVIHDKLRNTLIVHPGDYHKIAAMLARQESTR